MSILDIIIIVLTLIAAIRGFIRGFIIELATLIALFLGVYGGIYLSDFVAKWMIANWNVNENYVSLIAFAVVFLGIVILVIIIGRLISKMVSLMAMGFLNKLAGTLFSSIKIVFIISVLLILLDTYLPHYKLISQKAQDESMLYSPVKKIAPFTISKFKELYENKKLDSIKADSTQNQNK